MIPLFIGLTLANLLFLAAAAVLGYAWGGTQMAHWHLLSGASAALVCCAAHCIVFTYFIATSKWIQHAVAVKRLDPAFTAPTRSFKAQAFPAALVAMGTVFVAAFSGAATDVGYLGYGWHHIIALVAVGTNVLAVPVEFRAIRRNGELIDRILAAIAAADAQQGQPEDAPAVAVPPR